MRRPRPVRAVIFDAGNTLLRMDYGAISARLAQAGHAVSEAEVEEAELRARVRLDADLGAGRSTESGRIHEQYLRHVLEGLGITDEMEVEALSRWRRDYNPPIGLWNAADPASHETLARVKAGGLVAGVISNSNGSVGSILDAVGLTGGLDFVIDSAVVGVEKPDPRIFRLGLAAAGVAAEEAVYVGDLYSVDVLGARGAGVDGVLLDPRGYWGPRDCARAAGLLEAVRLALG